MCIAYDLAIGGQKTDERFSKIVTHAADHPFHIHVNPFQVVEVFDPNEKVKITGGAVADKYVFGPVQDASTQCSINADQPSTWRDCHNVVQKWGIWWDVFPIPSGNTFYDASNPALAYPIPGYFKMRSRFVDYTGQYVLHCHILAHEDRGMMTIVEVVPLITAYSHQ